MALSPCVVVLVVLAVVSQHTVAAQDLPCPCQTADDSLTPTFHMMTVRHGVDERGGEYIPGRNRSCTVPVDAGHLNDANAIFQHNGYYHVFFQGYQVQGFGWYHAVSKDLYRWKQLPNTFASTTDSEETWDVDCDGGLSFPSGIGAVILYGQNCGTPVPPSPPGAAVGAEDAPRVRVARPVNPHDPLLQDWLRDPAGAVNFTGIPCSFAGRVWQAHGKWHMLCAANALNNRWVRMSSNSSDLRTWDLADDNFTGAARLGGASGPMFLPLWNGTTLPYPNAPTHILNADGGSHFVTGYYDDASMKLVNISEKTSVDITGYSWATAGLAADGRILTTSWMKSGSKAVRGWPGGDFDVLNVPRVLSFDAAVYHQLVHQPVREIEALRLGPPLYNGVMQLSPGSTTGTPIPLVGSMRERRHMDIIVNFTLPPVPHGAGANTVPAATQFSFGAIVCAAAQGDNGTSGVTVNFTVVSAITMTLGGSSSNGTDASGLVVDRQVEMSVDLYKDKHGNSKRFSSGWPYTIACAACQHPAPALLILATTVHFACTPRTVRC